MQHLRHFSNYRIRKVEASTGVITTVAGDGTQGYSHGWPKFQLAVPQGGPRGCGGEISFVAGSIQQFRSQRTLTPNHQPCAGALGAASYPAGDGGPASAASLNHRERALDGAGTHVLDQNNAVVRKVTASTGIITTVAVTPGLQRRRTATRAHRGRHRRISAPQPVYRRHV